MIISVKSPAEARIAAASGADIVDVKEPARGSLGMADVWTLVQVSEELDGRTTSAATGDLGDLERFLNVPRAVLAPFCFVKVGSAGCPDAASWTRQWSRWMRHLPESVAPVAAAYADWQSADAVSPHQILLLAARNSARGVLIDTWDKARGSLFDVLPSEELDWLVRRGRSLNLWLALAGSLRLNTIGDAMLLRPHFIAVRGAVCAGPREGRLSARLVRRWIGAVQRASEQEACDAPQAPIS
jgi:hypothetical protein